MSLFDSSMTAATPRAAPHSQITHVLVCGATEPAIEIALFLRRLAEAVTLLADDLRAEPRQALERAGVRVVTGSPADPRALAEARAEEARAAVVVAPGDLASIEMLLAIRSSVPRLPLVCCVRDPDLAIRAERSLGARIAVCASAIEAVHLAGCCFGPDVIGAFALGEELVLLRRGAGQRRRGMRVLMIEERDGRCIIAPSAAMPIAPDSVVTSIEHVSSRGENRRSRVVRAIATAMRSMRGNTPPRLAWTAVVLSALAIASVFVFMAGMNIAFSDAAYLVLNTISTVGYGDITPFGSGKAMHLFGAFVALLGPALLGTLLLICARAVLRPQRPVAPARDHVIIAAPADVAATAASQLARASIESVVLTHPGAVDALLHDANARTASALIAATGDPAKNVTLGLAARELNPAIHVVAGGPARIAHDMAMATPPSTAAACVSLAASAALVGGLRYAITIGDRVFSFFEGRAGADWDGQRPSDVSGSYNFVALFRRSGEGPWQPANHDAAFDASETILVAAWRRLDPMRRNDVGRARDEA